MSKSLAAVDPEVLVRPEILSLKPYSSKIYPKAAKLDANENPFPWPPGMREEILQAEVPFNRYPDGSAQELKKALAGYTGVAPTGILAGNGSDELIQLILTVFGGKGRSVVLHPPTFVMYEAAARVTGTEVKEVPLKNGLDLDVEGMLAAAKDASAHVIVVCSPNNPTGSLFSQEQILGIVRESGKMVVVDEAYAEFAGESLVEEVTRYPNLLVMRTFSKAFGLAGLRLGYLLGHTKTIELLDRARQPYNVNVFTQRAGTVALRYGREYQEQVKVIQNEIQKIFRGLKEIPGIRVYPTAANFVLFQYSDSERLTRELLERGYLLRNLGAIPVLGPSLRVSTGLPAENEGFLQAVRESVTEQGEV